MLRINKLCLRILQKGSKLKTLFVQCMMIISVHYVHSLIPQSLYNHLCIDVTTMGVSSVFIYVWKRTMEGEKQIFFGPVNMPLTQGNTDDDRPRPLYLWENIYHESKLVFTCHTSFGEKNWEILSRRYTGKRVSV